MTTSETVTQRILFSGRVQGVGFRWSTRQLATARPIVGYVRNLSDGRVELVAQAESKQIEALLAELQRRFPGHVEEIEREDLPADDSLTNFDIRA